MARFQRGSLRIEDRKPGPTWVLRHYVTRQSDGQRVEHKFPIGLVRDLKTENAAWAEVERQHLTQQINEPTSRGRVTFSDIAHTTLRRNCLSALPRLHTYTATSFMIS